MKTINIQAEVSALDLENYTNYLTKKEVSAIRGVVTRKSNKLRFSSRPMHYAEELFYTSQLLKTKLEAKGFKVKFN